MPSTFSLLLLSLQNEGGAPTEGSSSGSPQGGFGSSMLVPLLAVFAIFYFVLIRPERKKQRQRESMLGAMKKGDKVMTTSGLLGTVVQVQEDVVTLQVADNVRLRFTRAAVQNVLGDKPTEKPAEEPQEAAKA